MSNTQLGQLVTVEPQSLTMLKITSAEFSFIEIWFTNQNNRPLEIEDNVNITLIIGTDHENRLLISKNIYTISKNLHKW